MFDCTCRHVDITSCDGPSCRSESTSTEVNVNLPVLYCTVAAASQLSRSVCMNECNPVTRQCRWMKSHHVHVHVQCKMKRERLHARISTSPSMRAAHRLSYGCLFVPPLLSSVIS